MSDSPPSAHKQPVSAFSPFYGCAIIAMAMFVFVGIIAWSLYSLLKQDEAIAAFAQSQPATLPALPEAGPADEALLQRLKQARSNPAESQISLSLEDLNRLLRLAPDGDYGSYRDMLRAVSMDPQRGVIVAQVSLPLNPLPLVGKSKRYLNGRVSYRPESPESGLDARVSAVEVEGRQVPEGFVSAMATWTLLGPYRQQPEVLGLLERVVKVEVLPQALRLHLRAAATEPKL